MRTTTATRMRTSTTTTPMITGISQSRDVGGDAVIVIGSSLADHKLTTAMDKFYTTSTPESLTYHRPISWGPEFGLGNG